MVRNSFRDRKEGYTDKAVVIRLVLSYNKVVLRHSVIIHLLVLVIIMLVLVYEMSYVFFFFL